MSDEVTTETISKTQKALGKYVSRPPLTDKLLKKPPFRFLHDVINTVIKETGFLKGLFSEAELLSDNVKEREAKVAFLNKLIAAIKDISGTDLQVRASKIIAGLEPTETNKLLQAIGAAIDKKLDSKEYIAQLKGKVTAKSKSKEPEKAKRTTSKASVKSNDSTKVKTSSRESVRSDSKPRVKEAPAKKTSKTEVKASKEVAKSRSVKTKDSPRDSKRGKESPKTVKKPKESPRELKKVAIVEDVVPPVPIMDKDVIADDVVEDSLKPTLLNDLAPEDKVEIQDESFPQEMVERKPSAERPKSAARPRSEKKEPLQKKEVAIEDKVVVIPDLLPEKSDVEKIVLPEKPALGSKPEVKPLEIKPPEPPILRPKSSLRPPSVRPSSARPGAPRLRPDSSLPLKELVPLGKINVIVENYDAIDGKDEDEEETVVIQNVADEVPDQLSIEKSLDIPADKGHLVEQILEQIQAPELLEEPTKDNNNWENDNAKGRDATTKEITQLRASIQSLTKTANPLGKLMSYLHEDIEAMHTELDSWTNLKRQYVAEIKKQDRTNADSNQPLIMQLQEIEENIKRQREEIATVKFNVLRNEEKIRDIISKQVSAQ